MLITRPQGIPRHDFECIRREILWQNDGMPPGACRPQQIEEKNNVQDMGLKKWKNDNVDIVRPPERGFRGAQPLGMQGFGAGS